VLFFNPFGVLSVAKLILQLLSNGFLRLVSTGADVILNYDILFSCTTTDFTLYFLIKNLKTLFKLWNLTDWKTICIFFFYTKKLRIKTNLWFGKLVYDWDWLFISKNEGLVGGFAGEDIDITFLEKQQQTLNDKLCTRNNFIISIK
jgi:hypothetical protein